MTRCGPLAVLLAVVAMLMSPSPRTAAASSAVQPETRVGGFELLAPTLVRLFVSPSPEKHAGNSVAYGETAQCHSLAAEAAPAAPLEMAQQQLGLTVAEDAPGLHAEVTVLQHAAVNGLTPLRGISANIICAGSCAPMIQERAAR